MIARKLFADQIRANSLSGITNSTTTTTSMDGQKKGAQTTTTSITTTFPASVPGVNRRVVQVHPMCMNSTTGDHQQQEYQGQRSSSSSASSSSSSSSGQCSPPNMAMQNVDVAKVNNKPRPPVPKKPARLVVTKSEPSVPARPPKPYTTNGGQHSNGDGVVDYMDVSYGQRENGASPYKQRKQLEDEEKCRELFNYVAQKSNDSSLKQILAPNQRSSVDYLEECFASVRLSALYGGGENGLGGGGGGDAKELAHKNSFYATSMNLQNGSG